MSAASDGSSELESRVTPDRWDRGRKGLQNLLRPTSPRHGLGCVSGNFADPILVSFRL